jgi:hypothetical protein
VGRPSDKLPDLLTHSDAWRPCVPLHVLAMMKWLTSEPLRTLSGSEIEKWMDQQKPKWSSGYRKLIRQGVSLMVADAQSASAEELKSRMLLLIDEMIPTCKELVMGTAAGGGTTIMTDPDTGKRLVKYNHQAVQGYLKLIAEFTGVVQQHQDAVARHLHLHMTNPDLSGIPDDKLDEMIEANKREILRLQHQPEPAQAPVKPKE